jgi:hypothetical protein
MIRCAICSSTDAQSNQTRKKERDGKSEERVQAEQAKVMDGESQEIRDIKGNLQPSQFSPEVAALTHSHAPSIPHPPRRSTGSLGFLGAGNMY